MSIQVVHHEPNPFRLWVVDLQQLPNLQSPVNFVRPSEACT